MAIAANSRFAPDARGTVIASLARSDMFAQLDAHDVWAGSLARPDVDDSEGQLWCESAHAVHERIEALPNTKENLHIRARAIGSIVDYTSDVGNLDLTELMCCAEGIAGRIIRQILVCLTAH